MVGSIDIKNLEEVIKLGQAFSDTERDLFFLEGTQNPRKVNYGAALSHAGSVAWTPEKGRELYWDCAFIMALEIRKYQKELGEEEPVVTAAQVSRIPEFRWVCDATRETKEILLIRLASNRQDPDYLRFDHLLNNLHEKLYVRIKRSLFSSLKKGI